MRKLIVPALVLSLLFTPFMGTVAPVYAADTGSDVEADATKFALITTGVIVGLLVLIGVISASADDEAQKAHREQLKNFENVYNTKVGKMSYDDMLLEYGKPTEVTEGDAVKIAVYDKRVTNETTNTEYQHATFLSNATSQAQTVKSTSGEVLTFSFDKKTKKLLKWRYQNYSANSLTDDISGPK